MRVLVLCHEYPPIGGGGGRVAQDICAGLAARGHEVRLVTAAFGSLPREETQNGVTIHRLVSGRKQEFRAGLGAMLGYLLAGLPFCLRLVRRWQPDVIHVHFAVPAGALGLALKILTRTPCVITAHLGDVPGGVPEKTGKWFRFLYPITPPIWRGARAVCAVSSFTAQLAEKAYPGVTPVVIPNGVDLRDYDPGEIKVNHPPRVAFAGRFVPQKNPLQVVYALNEVKDLPWTCVMAGDGALKPEVEALVDSLGLRERFTFPGWLTPAEVKGVFAGSDILFLPSLSEGLPVVGVQGMAMGLALLLSRAGGNPDLVEAPRNGYLCDPDDTAGFASALRTWLSDPAELLAARQSSRQLAQVFSLERVVEKYEEILSNAAR
ncbi:MAG: glycosyltransferase family 4 protein [Leptolinea sp.]|jgi:glycosyltransferase involved in cell wall biosynthesis|nr:glycosyltransferase family 4 protein [Leptolinea sp.]